MQIEDWYGDKTAARSGVPLINHIHEGTKILKYLEASPEVIAAFRYHPMFQEDELLAQHAQAEWIKNITPQCMLYIMEYRNIANQSLSDMVDYNSGGIGGGYYDELVKRIV